MKRSTTEVMRGIIEEYMEEIKLAGGIGCLVKGSAEARSFPNEPVHVEYPNASSLKSNSFDKSRRQPDSINKLPHDSDDRSNSHQSLSSKNCKRQNSEPYKFVELFEDHKNSSRNRHGNDHVSSSSISVSQRRSEDRTYRKKDHKEVTKSRPESISAVNSRDRKSRSVSSTSNSMKRTVMNSDEPSDSYEDRYDPAFDDRYDPSNSQTTALDGDDG